MTVDPTDGGGGGGVAGDPLATLSIKVREQNSAPARCQQSHPEQARGPSRTPDGCGVTHLPDQVLLGPGRCRQADAQHDGVGGRGEHAGDDGVSHAEGQHGVHHEDDEEEERHLQAEDENSGSHRDAPTPMPPLSSHKKLREPHPSKK